MSVIIAENKDFPVYFLNTSLWFGARVSIKIALWENKVMHA